MLESGIKRKYWLRRVSCGADRWWPATELGAGPTRFWTVPGRAHPSLQIFLFLLRISPYTKWPQGMAAGRLGESDRNVWSCPVGTFQITRTAETQSPQQHTFITFTELLRFRCCDSVHCLPCWMEMPATFSRRNLWIIKRNWTLDEGLKHVPFRGVLEDRRNDPRPNGLRIVWSAIKHIVQTGRLFWRTPRHLARQPKLPRPTLSHENRIFYTIHSDSIWGASVISEMSGTKKKH